MSDWRSEVKLWSVQPFFGAWVVVPDPSQNMYFCYKTRWRWLAIREARRLVSVYGGALEVRG